MSNLNEVILEYFDKRLLIYAKRQEALMNLSRVVRFAVENDLDFVARRIVMYEVETALNFDDYCCAYEAAVAELWVSGDEC